MNRPIRRLPRLRVCGRPSFPRRGGRRARRACQERHVHPRRRDQRRRHDDPAARAPHEPPPPDLGPARPVLPPTDRAAEPEAPRGHHGQPNGPRRCARRRQGPPPRRPPPAARDPGHRQGQHRHDRHADDRRLVGAQGQLARRTPSSSSSCAPPARSSSPRRTCPSGRTSGRPVVERLERHRRPDEHALRPRSQPVRLELRLRRRRLGRPRNRRRRHRDGRLDRLPVRRRTATSASSRRSGS